MNIALSRQKFPEYFQQNIQDTEVVVRMFICHRKYCVSHIVCIFLPQCNDKIFWRKRFILSGIGPLFVLVKVHRTSMIFFTIGRTSIIFWFWFSSGCFYQHLYSIIFSGRGNLLKLIPVVWSYKHYFFPEFITRLC